MNRQQRLSSITRFHDKQDIAAFLADTVRPALEAIVDQMREGSLSAHIEQKEDRLDLTIPHGEYGQFCYTVRARRFRAPSFAFAETPKTDGVQPQHFRAIAHTSEGDQPHDVTGFNQIRQ